MSPLPWSRRGSSRIARTRITPLVGSSRTGLGVWISAAQAHFCFMLGKVSEEAVREGARPENSRAVSSLFVRSLGTWVEVRVELYFSLDVRSS